MLTGDSLRTYKKTIGAILASYALIVPCRSVTVVGEDEEEAPQDLSRFRESLIDRFLSLAATFVEVNIKKGGEKKDFCPNCEEELEQRCDGLWCPSCPTFVQSSKLHAISPEGSFSGRSVSDKMAHFKTIVLEFQGMEDYVMEEGDLKTIKKYSLHYRIDLSDVTRSTLLHILERVNLLQKLENHINLLHHIITGQPRHDISHIEERIFARHREVMGVYNEVKPQERRHSLKNWYVFARYLEEEEYEVNFAELPLLRMKDTLDWHNKMYRIVALRLIKGGTNFTWSTNRDLVW
jgi:hypothetical protein